MRERSAAAGWWRDSRESTTTRRSRCTCGCAEVERQLLVLKRNRECALGHVAPEVAGLTDREVAGRLVLDRRVVPDHHVVCAPVVRIPWRVLLGMILELLQQGSPVCDRHTFDMGRTVQIEVQRRSAGNGMGPNDGIADVDECLVI